MQACSAAAQESSTDAAGSGDSGCTSAEPYSPGPLATDPPHSTDRH